MELKPGEKLGRYQLRSPIGAGGMGEVWKARDTQLELDVALKFSKDAFTARFDREARAIAAFNHPNICQIYDVGPNYLVMELIDGSPLKGPLPVDKAVAYAGLILDAFIGNRVGFGPAWSNQVEIVAGGSGPPLREDWRAGVGRRQLPEARRKFTLSRTIGVGGPRGHPFST